jgi:beta-glucanase (GH16 family)
MLTGTCDAQVGPLVWEDDFNSGQLDDGAWNIETGTGVNGDWGTGQVDRATGRTQNISFQNEVPGAENGCMVITTQKESYIDRNYTSGRINTAGKVSWGQGHRIVARVYPRDVRYQGQGFAFWMMPDEVPEGWDYIMWPQGGELDIMEYVGVMPYHNLGSVHYAWFWENNQWQSWNHGHQGYYYSYASNDVPEPEPSLYSEAPPAINDENAGCNAFHTYGIDWYNDRLEFFVDDHVYHIHYFNDGGAFLIDGQDEAYIKELNSKNIGVSECSNHFAEWHPFEHQMYVILSAGVGGSSNTYGGAIVSEAEFPCSVFVDWVRVYQLDESTNFNHKTSVQAFSCYPNPAANELNFTLGNPGIYQLKIVDLSGQVLKQATINKSATINVADLQNGLYLIWLHDGVRSVSKQLIISR